MEGKDKAGMMKMSSQKSRDYTWNTIAGLINASEAIILSMVVTRITGLADAGILTIAFAVGNLMMTVGKFGVRNYQVTDIENRFSFSVYLKTRVLTVLLMTVTVFVYLGYASIRLGYDHNKMEIILLICMIYAVEAIEDVFWGYYQRNNRMDVGARMFCFRWIGIFTVFFVALRFGRNLRFTLLLCFVVSSALFVSLVSVFHNKLLSCGELPDIVSEDKHKARLIQRKDIIQIGQLLKTVFALFGISFLSFYVNNAPRYAIDACLSDEVQACYGFVAMPVFVVGLLNNFIYQPTLVDMAVEWEQRQDKKFIHRICRQFGVIATISVICLAGAYILGIPALSWLYHTDLSAYKRELMILLIAGGFLAISGYLNVILTIMRCQKTLLWPYCLVAMTAVVCLKKIVSQYGTIGAAAAYLGLMVLLCALYGMILVSRLKKKCINSI